MRDGAIIRATLRELAPLHLGTLALGLLVAVTAIDTKSQEHLGGPNTWPLMVLPLAALWGGLTIGGGSRATLVHLLSRPVARLRILAWRWALLLGGLLLVALPLVWIGLFQYSRGPSLSTVAIATVLASIFGAQGGALSDRELYSLGGAMMFGSALWLPVQLGLQAQQLTWLRVNELLGWGWLVPMLCACVLFAAPVIWTWKRALPVRGIEASMQLVLGSLGATLLFLALVAWPTMAWVGAPERGQLISVVTLTPEGPIVATGTLGAEGDRDVVDGLVRIDESGERHVIWNRRAELPDGTVWKIAVPEATMHSPFDDSIQLAVVDGPEPDDAHPLETIEVKLEIELEQASKVEDSVPTYGPPGARQFSVRWNQVWTPLYIGRPLARIRASEIPFMRGGAHVVGAGRIWAVNEKAELWSAPVPWEVAR